MREHYKHEAEKQSQKVLKYFQNSKLQAEEKADRLRKENAQLRGVIEEQHKSCIPKGISDITKAIRFNPLPSPKGERPNGSLTQWSVAQC